MGHELTFRGGRGRPVQMRRQKQGWTAARRDRFLDLVAATCNVRLAAEEIGLTLASVYALRRREPEFGERWRMALLAGYDRLEGELLRKSIHALEDGVDGTNDPDTLVKGPVTFDQAMSLLERHRKLLAQGERPVRRAGYKEATEAETNEALEKKLASLRRKREEMA